MLKISVARIVVHVDFGMLSASSKVDGGVQRTRQSPQTIGSLSVPIQRTSEPGAAHAVLMNAPQERFQSAQQIEIVADLTDCLDRFERRASEEDRQLLKQGFFGRGEEVIAPTDGSPQRLLAGRDIPGRAGQKFQAIPQLVEHFLRGQNPHARCGQLNGER